MARNFDWRDSVLLERWVGKLSCEWWLPERGEQGRGGGVNRQYHREMVVHWEVGKGNIVSGGWLSKRGEQEEDQEELVLQGDHRENHGMPNNS